MTKKSLITVRHDRGYLMAPWPRWRDSTKLPSNGCESSWQCAVHHTTSSRIYYIYIHWRANGMSLRVADAVAEKIRIWVSLTPMILCHHHAHLLRVPYKSRMGLIDNIYNIFWPTARSQRPMSGLVHALQCNIFYLFI